ncbi:hypothetical protein HBI81_026150 [Parastagonospora nodorum]|nr:hypothetical protein HBH52_104540 [Parastagonospora nodorum]KAH4035486.1 hypothetical protein HBI09_087470 [Parastagonospora nodorum]KAH4068528.1 hypothetical protein HBH50_115120 [Parastagonospora nodorum]KAH4100119.1 hypothetical protein HBH48_016660 [Parastagonospora nodorum]KAH4105478.1 hypothetical protein HBH46_079790 [Parastagonospora nodorum]
MAVQDPNFWRRFSTAVHQDDVQKGTPHLKHSGSWLASQKKKSRQRTWLCWCFWLGLMGLVAGVVTAVLILRREGILKF